MATVGTFASFATIPVISVIAGDFDPSSSEPSVKRTPSRQASVIIRTEPAFDTRAQAKRSLSRNHLRRRNWCCQIIVLWHEQTVPTLFDAVAKKVYDQLTRGVRVIQESPDIAAHTDSSEILGLAAPGAVRDYVSVEEARAQQRPPQL